MYVHNLTTTLTILTTDWAPLQHISFIEMVMNRYALCKSTLKSRFRVSINQSLNGAPCHYHPIPKENLTGHATLI